ncbi:MAG: alpha/beta hydrolase fold domain-containing protein, partial [Phycisphaerae bacterium]
PITYGAWIKHLVRRGHIVIFPVFQDGLDTPVAEMTPNARRALSDAWEWLSRDAPVRPRSNGPAFVGHSIGGFIAANLAASATRDGLPPPAALMLVQPSNGAPHIRDERRLLQLEHLDAVPARTLAMAVVGDADRLASEVGARLILDALTGVPKHRKTLIIVQSDNRTDPPLEAHHASPTGFDASIVPQEQSAAPTPDDPPRGGGGFRDRIRQRVRDRIAERVERPTERSRVDALDYYGYWRLFDILLATADRPAGSPAKLAKIPDLCFMGRLPDGAPVRPLRIEALP